MMCEDYSLKMCWCASLSACMYESPGKHADGRRGGKGAGGGGVGQGVGYDELCV